MTRPRVRGRGHDVGGGLVDEMPPPGAAFHFRADLGIAAPGGAMAAWADQSGNGRHMVQATPASQFTHTPVSSAYGNRAVLTSDGGDHLDVASTWTLAQPDTIYVVGDMVGPSYETFFDGNGGARQIIRSSPVFVGGMYAGSAEIVTAVDVRSPSIMCAVFNGASSALYINSTTAGVTGNPGNSSLTDLRIGAAPTGIYPLGNGGRIAELIGYSGAHSAATRALVLGYLSRRYNLPVAGL